jgi:rubrerythrin
VVSTPSSPLDAWSQAVYILVAYGKKFRDFSEREILALAISLEEEDARIYADYADALRDGYPSIAKIFDEMRAEEIEHRNRLIETYRSRFGEHIPLIRRQGVKGFIQRRPLWLSRPLKISDVRKQVEVTELETRRFYDRAVAQVTDLGIRKLLGDLAEVERRHYRTAESLEETITPAVEQKEDAQRRLFVLQIVQPGLAGLMDGSASLSLRCLPPLLQPRTVGPLSSSG